MKQPLTTVLYGLSILAAAQCDSFQYPFPYNPDGNSDGYISLSDMLDLLTLYGQEFPQSFFSDTTVAVLNLGTMGAHTCQAQAKLAGSDWRILRISDVSRFLPGIAATLSSSSIPKTGYCQRDDNQSMTDGMSWSVENNPDEFNYDYVFSNDSVRLRFQVNQTTSTYYPTTKRHCFLVSEVRPEFEFSYCNTGSDGDFTTCVTEKLNDGWIPMPGGTKNSASYFYQGFWRVVED